MGQIFTFASDPLLALGQIDVREHDREHQRGYVHEGTERRHPGFIGYVVLLEDHHRRSQRRGADRTEQPSRGDGVFGLDAGENRKGDAAQKNNAAAENRREGGGKQDVA